MSDFFKHRADAEEIAGDRIKRTGMLSIIRMTKQHGGGFFVIDINRKADMKPTKEIELMPGEAHSGFAPVPDPQDMKMDWINIVPSLLMLLEGGSKEAQLFARAELIKMARLADAYVASKRGCS